MKVWSAMASSDESKSQRTAVKVICIPIQLVSQALTRPLTDQPGERIGMEEQTSRGICDRVGLWIRMP